MLESVYFWLLPWALFLNLLGQEIKKMNLPKVIKDNIPIVLLVCSCVVCGAFGFAHTVDTGFKQIVDVVGKYTLVNGLVVWLVAIADYSVVMNFIQKRLPIIKAKLFKKKEAVNEENN